MEPTGIKVLAQSINLAQHLLVEAIVLLCADDFLFGWLYDQWIANQAFIKDITCLDITSETSYFQHTTYIPFLPINCGAVQLL